MLGIQQILAKNITGLGEVLVDIWHPPTEMCNQYIH